MIHLKLFDSNAKNGFLTKNVQPDKSLKFGLANAAHSANYSISGVKPFAVTGILLPENCWKEFVCYSWESESIDPALIQSFEAEVACVTCLYFRSTTTRTCAGTRRWAASTSLPTRRRPSHGSSPTAAPGTAGWPTPRSSRSTFRYVQTGGRTAKQMQLNPCHLNKTIEQIVS